MFVWLYNTAVLVGLAQSHQMEELWTSNAHICFMLQFLVFSHKQGTFKKDEGEMSLHDGLIGYTASVHDVY